MQRSSYGSPCYTDCYCYSTVAQSWCHKFHISVSGHELYLWLFNSLISQLRHYHAIASEKFICFLWSAVDGHKKKYKPCFWRNMLQSGPNTRLPALTYTQLQFSAHIILGNQDPCVDSKLSKRKMYKKGKGGWVKGYFLNYFIAIYCRLLRRNKI